MSATLPLYAEILLLSLRDKEGTIMPSAQYQLAMSGAILAELLLQRKLQLVHPKKKLVEVKDASPIGDVLLDECLNKINNARRRARAQTWVQRFSGIKHLKHQVAEMLCQRGILRHDKEKILLIFERQVYPEIDPAPEQEIIKRLRAAVLEEHEEIAPRTIILLSLTKRTNLLKSFLSRSEQKVYKKRIESIVNGEVIGNATQEAIEAIQTAIMVACIVPAIAATTTH